MQALNKYALTGTVARLADLQTYGWITPDKPGAKELFFHVSAIHSADRRRLLKDGARVSYTIIKDPVKPGQLNAGSILVLSEPLPKKEVAHAQ